MLFKEAILRLYPFNSKGYKDVVRIYTTLKRENKVKARKYAHLIISRALKGDNYDE